MLIVVVWEWSLLGHWDAELQLFGLARKIPQMLEMKASISEDLMM